MSNFKKRESVSLAKKKDVTLDKKDSIAFLLFKIIFFPFLIMGNPKIYFKDEIEEEDGRES